MSKVTNFFKDPAGALGFHDSEGKSSVSLPEMSPEEKAITEQIAKAVSAQLGVIERQAELQRKLFEQVPGLFGEAASAADIAASQQFGGQLSDPEREAIQGAIDNALKLGEADITRFRDEGLREIQTRLAPERGLRTSDSPILNEAADVVREAQFQQGQLVRGLRGQGAEATFNRIFERDKLKGILQQAAFDNRLNLAGGISNVGLGLNPNVNIPSALSVVQAPRLGQPKTVAHNTMSTVEGFQRFGSGFGGLFGGVG